MSGRRSGQAEEVLEIMWTVLGETEPQSREVAPQGCLAMGQNWAWSLSSCLPVRCPSLL